MTEPYKFSDPAGLDVRTWHSYVPYAGAAFVQAWRSDRDRAAEHLPPPLPPPPAAATSLPDADHLDGDAVMEWLWADLPNGSERARQAFERVLARFEVVRKVAPAYDRNFKPLETQPRGSLQAHVRLAECFARAHEQDGFLGTLNALIKAVDTLIALSDGMDAHCLARLHGLIMAERRAIVALAARIGVEV